MEGVISPMQRPLPDNTQNSQVKVTHALLLDSNPQPQQTSGRRPLPYTSQPLGSALYVVISDRIEQDEEASNTLHVTPSFLNADSRLAHSTITYTLWSKNYILYSELSATELYK